MTIAEFCTSHHACDDGREWALANCRDMAHAWETLRPGWLIWLATRPGVLDDRTLRLFAVWSARQVQHLMADKRSIGVLEVADRHANGQATDEEMAAAREAAWDASAAAWGGTSADARKAAREAAREAARAAALAAGLEAGLEAARDAELAACAAAWAAALKAARADARKAAREAARDAQADWLRQNAKPSFDGGAR